MNHKISEMEAFTVYGLKTLLTRSQRNNYTIIRNHWTFFNAELRRRNLTKRDWLKFAVTIGIDNEYYYLAGIHGQYEVPGFEEITIVKGKYLYCQHKGDMNSIKNTLYQIYKNVIPENSITIDKDRNLIHYEKYDKMFKWNSPDSLVHIYVPVNQ